MPHGKTVTCIGDPETPHEVDRTLCILGSRPGCYGCPNRLFTVRFQVRAVDHVVACPRWLSEKERLDRKEPVNYESVPRIVCLTQRPFRQCEDCPNSKASEAPRIQPRWWEYEEKKRLLELALDEEDKG